MNKELKIDSLKNFSQAADYLSISRPTFYALVKMGKFHPVIIATVRYIFKEELDSYLRDGRDK